MPVQTAENADTEATETPGNNKNAAEKGDTANDGQVKYSDRDTYDFSKSFSEQIDDFKNKKFPKDDTLIMGRTPETFTKIGLLPLPMTYTQKHAKEALKNADGDHLGETLLKQVPKALESPVAIIDSETVPGRIVAILELKQGNNNVIAAVEIEGTGTMHGDRIDSNAVASAYSKENAIYRLLKNAVQSEVSSQRGIYYWDKKRAIQLARIHGVQFPGSSTITDGYVHSITEFRTNVNSFLKNIFETKQFKRWFGDWETHPERINSVFVDESGAPKIFYYGSKKGGGFTTFRSWQYFTDKEAYAQRYAQRDNPDSLYAVYYGI